MAVTLMLLNVKGLNIPYKRTMLWQEVKTAKVDIMCAQETHLLTESAAKLRQPLFPHIFSACCDKKKSRHTHCCQKFCTIQPSAGIFRPARQVSHSGMLYR